MKTSSSPIQTAITLLLLFFLPLCASHAEVADTSDVDSATIRGDYVEARTADVFTGPCFANSEMNLAGREAVLAWRIEAGEWQGTDLESLEVVAVVRADSTLGDSDTELGNPRSVLLVDERATEQQQEALVGFAREMAGELLTGLVAVEVANIDFEVGAHGSARVSAGEHLVLETRGLHDGDHLCGNEVVFYPPLSQGIEAHPGVTLEHRFSGEGVGATWSSPHKRSAFVGRFLR